MLKSEKMCDVFYENVPQCLFSGPEPVNNIRFSNPSPVAFFVEWNDPCSTGCPLKRRASYYRLHYKPNNGEEKSFRVEKNELFFRGLNSNTRYTISITTRSFDMNGQLVESDRSLPAVKVTSKSHLA